MIPVIAPEPDAAPVNLSPGADAAFSEIVAARPYIGKKLYDLSWQILAPADAQLPPGTMPVPAVRYSTRDLMLTWEVRDRSVQLHFHHLHGFYRSCVLFTSERGSASTVLFTSEDGISWVAQSLRPATSRTPLSVDPLDLHPVAELAGALQWMLNAPAFTPNLMTNQSDTRSLFPEETATA